MGNENMREKDGHIAGGTERESNGRDILIEDAIMGLRRNLELAKFPGIYKNDLK